MKIIDENGRFFGIINLIDLMALVILFILVRMLFLGYVLYEWNKLSTADGHAKVMFAAREKYNTQIIVQQKKEDREVEIMLRLNEIDSDIDQIKESLALVNAVKKLSEINDAVKIIPNLEHRLGIIEREVKAIQSRLPAVKKNFFP